MQFVGIINSDMPRLVWKSWAPPKIKYFAWLIIQDRVWTGDRPNCGLCKLCNQEPESAAHLLFGCRYTIRVWGLIKDWLGLPYIVPTSWSAWPSVEDWWCGVLGTAGIRP